MRTSKAITVICWLVCASVSPLTFAGQARSKDDTAWQGRIADEVRRMVTVDVDHKGCAISADHSLPLIEKEIHSLSSKKDTSTSLLMILFGGDNVFGSYFVLGHDKLGSFVVTDGRRINVSIAVEHRLKQLMDDGSRSKPQTSAPSPPESSDNLWCTVAIDLSLPDRRALTSISNNNGLDHRVLSEISGTFDQINESQGASEE